jgi:hypothetical protein
MTQAAMVRLVLAVMLRMFLVVKLRLVLAPTIHEHSKLFRVASKQIYAHSSPGME